jgi:hypothetical protein
MALSPRLVRGFLVLAASLEMTCSDSLFEGSFPKLLANLTTRRCRIITVPREVEERTDSERSCTQRRPVRLHVSATVWPREVSVVSTTAPSATSRSAACLVPDHGSCGVAEASTPTVAHTGDCQCHTQDTVCQSPVSASCVRYRCRSRESRCLCLFTDAARHAHHAHKPITHLAAVTAAGQPPVAPHLNRVARDASSLSLAQLLRPPLSLSSLPSLLPVSLCRSVAATNHLLGLHTDRSGSGQRVQAVGGRCGLPLAAAAVTCW